MAQASVHARISRRVEAYGPRPEWHGESALENLLRSNDLYSAAPSSVRPYEADKLKVLFSGIVAASLRERLPPEGQGLADHASSLICRGQVDHTVACG